MLRSSLAYAFAVTVLLGLTGCLPPANAPQRDAIQAQTAPQQKPISRDSLPFTADDQEKAEAEERAKYANIPTKTVKVGLLVPLTGRNAELGKAMQDAATVSLFDKYARLTIPQQATHVELLPKDTGDSPEYARYAAEAAIKDGAQLLIGPVFAEDTQAVASVAAAKNIAVLSFSNNRAKAAPGSYLLGFSPHEQAQRVVDYALKHDKKRVAVLLPRSALGEEVLAGARAASLAAGVALAAEVRYAPQAIGLEEALSKLLPGNGEGVAFDALLLAENGDALETILRALNARGVSQANVQLLGTGIWDDVNLLRSVNLDGAWFASSPPESTAQFENRFRATYNYTPPRLASLAYDGVALAVTLATSDRAYNAANFTNPAGFVGPANGVFRLKANGTIERNLAVIQVDGSNLRILSPAPTGFVK